MSVLQQKWTPRYFTLLTHGIWLPFNIIWPQRFWPPNVIDWLLKGLNFISHFAIYITNIKKLLQTMAESWQQHNVVSINMNREPSCTPWPESFSSDITPSMWSANRTGVKTPPCRTPHNTGNRPPSTLFHFTLHCRLLYQYR